MNNILGVWLKKIYASVWLFPLLLSFLLLLLTSLQISGTSAGIYNSYFYGGAKEDRSLIANQPQSVRSDEWLVNTQMTIAQKNNNYERINNHIGNGSDVSVLIDAPYKEWSVIFKPHNLAFFVMPFDNAFAFRWWFMAYLLLMSCYFFIITLMPNRRLLGTLLSSALLFSPFVQWWYLYGTMGSLYYSLFGGIIFMKILNEKSKLNLFLWGLLLSYVATCFALILYPPFQIPCAFAMLSFAIGYGVERSSRLSRRLILQKIGIIFCALFLAVILTLGFFATRTSVFRTINETTYPGNRISKGGGYDFTKLHSGYLQTQLQTKIKAVNYKANQSENSSFILLAPFLIVPSVFLLIMQRKNKRTTDWPLLLVSFALLVLWTHILTPLIDPLLKPFFFSKVPVARSLIGLGLLNILQIVLFIRHTQKINVKKYTLLTRLYTILVLLSTFCLALATHHRFPGYIGIPKGLLLSAVLTLIVYLVLSKRFVAGVALLLVLSVYSTYQINPLYRGTEPLTKTSLSLTIQDISKESDGKWISESVPFENFPQMNGAPSLSGVYAYPQTDIWKNLPPKDPKIYNRYTHVIFVINHTSSNDVETRLKLVQNDAFIVLTEPCSRFLRDQNVKYILAQAPITNNCLKLRATVPYAVQNFFIYEIR